MKNLIYIFLLGLMIYSCGTTKNTGDFSSNSGINGDTLRIANDSLEYEVIIVEPGFDYWLKSTAKPRSFYTQSFLENKNRQWVTEYNSRVYGSPQDSLLYPHEINYEYGTDYGFEVNYLLYNYLLFFQERYDQNF